MVRLWQKIAIWPIFDIFHRLRPYLCSEREEVGFHKQATHRRRNDEPFFYFGVHCPWLGMAQNGPIWTKNGQTLQACQRSKLAQKGPKGTKLVNLSVFDNLGPLLGPSGNFWSISDKNDFFRPKMDKVGFGRGASKQNIILDWNGLLGSRWAQKGPKW